MIDLNLGYPFGVTVYSVPATDGEKQVSLANMKIFHNLEDAIDEYVTATHMKYGQLAEVRLIVLGEKKAADGVWEQDNKLISKYRVHPPKNITNSQNNN